MVWIGPHIGACCFEVKQDFFVDKPDWLEHQIDHNNKFFIDLASIVCRQLQDRGVLGNNISVSSMCTCCQVQEFFSYRRQGAEAGRMLALTGYA